MAIRRGAAAGGNLITVLGSGKIIGERIARRDAYTGERIDRKTHLLMLAANATGTVIIGKIAARASARAAAGSGNVWRLHPFERGVEIEKPLGHTLPRNLPVIDRWSNGVATSIKSIDLGSATYQSTARLNRLLRGYVDKVAAFRGQTWAGFSIDASQISGRALEVDLRSG